MRVDNAGATLTAFPGETTPEARHRDPADDADRQPDAPAIAHRTRNRGGRLRPGMFANVTLGGNAKPALLVPSEAVILARTASSCLATGDRRYHPPKVEQGARAAS